MTRAKTPVPRFKSDAEEREFWDSTDLTDVVPTEKWERSRASRGPTTTFAVRLEQNALAQIREIASAREIGATQLARAWILDRLRLELAAGELANPEADERELQIRRAVMDDVAKNIPDLVLGALAALGIGAAVGKTASSAKRSAAEKKRDVSKGKGNRPRQTGSKVKEAAGG